MKYIVVLFLIIQVILCTSFARKESPFVILSSGTISVENIKYRERVFSVGQRVNYAIVAPDRFKDSAFRMQLSTQNEKTTNWGFEIIETNDIYTDKTQTVYRDYVVPRKTGHYILQFFYASNRRYPFAHVEFMVR